MAISPGGEVALIACQLAILESINRPAHTYRAESFIDDSVALLRKCNGLVHDWNVEQLRSSQGDQQEKNQCPKK